MSTSLEPAEWIRILESGQFPETGSRCFLVRGVRIAVFREGGEWFAFDDECPHAGAPLSDGWLEDACVVCPWHGARFRLEDGEAVSPPARTGVKIWPIRERDAWLELGWA